MSDEKFSPGEWISIDPDNNVNNPKVCGQLVRAFEIYSKSDTAWIAQVLEIQNKHGVANAALIEQAPEMYRTLERVFKLLEYSDDAQCVIGDVELVLQKARGE